LTFVPWFIKCSPVLSMKQSGNNSVVECNLAKVEVASSNLVSRSTSTPQGSTLLEPFFINDSPL
jgi:hypothetical protein